MKDHSQLKMLKKWIPLTKKCSSSSYIKG